MTSTLLPPTSQMNKMNLEDRDDPEHHTSDVNTPKPSKLYPAIIRQPSRLIELPDLPESAVKSKRYYFYGWNFTSSWLTDLAMKHRPPRGPYLTFAEHLRGLRYIREESGFKHCHWVDGAVEDGEVYEQTYETERGDMIMNVMAITTNAIIFGRWLSERRPTEEQLEKLMLIFGCPPRWFMDGRRKGYFLNYDVHLD